jgi:transcriptional regulator with XRE-family HTH domain
MTGKFSDNLRVARKARGLTQGELAEKLGVTGGYISDLEKGKRSPSDSLVSLATIELRLSRNWLLTGEGEMFEEEALKAPAGFLEKELVRVVIEAVEEGLGDLHLELKPDKKAQLVITLCEMFQEEKQVDIPTILRLIKLAA